MEQDMTEQAIEVKRDDARKREDVTTDTAAPQGDINPAPTAGKLPEAPKAAEAEAPADGKKKKREFVSAGEKLHFWLTYGGIDWILNSAIGVTFTFWGARTKMGQNLYTKPVQAAFRTIFRPFIKNEETLGKVASGWNDFLSIMIGGTAINPLITSIEGHKNKKAISKWFDGMIYGKEKVENDPKFKKAYDEIDQQPTKDTKGVWIARGLAIAPLWFLASNATTRNFMKSNTTLKIPFTKSYLNFDTISDGTRRLAEFIGIRPKGMMSKVIIDETSKLPVSDWQALHNYIAFDYGLTIPYAITHAFWYSVIAKYFSDHKKTDPKHAKEPAVVTSIEKAPSPDNHSPIKDQPRPTVSQVSLDAQLARMAPVNQLST